MSGYGLTFTSTMCSPKTYGSKFAAISIFMIYIKNNCVLLGIYFSLREKPTPPQNLTLVMLAFATMHLYPTWTLHSGTSKDEIGSPPPNAPPQSTLAKPKTWF